MEFQSIGTIANGYIEDRGRDWREVVSEVRLAPRYAPALEGLEEYSHIIVLFHAHWAHPAQLKTHPDGWEDLPEVGVLATRTASRPNPIALTVVRLLARKDNVLRVQGLDALDGTPVIDVKPYIPQTDNVLESRAPQWVETLSSRWKDRK